MKNIRIETIADMVTPGMIVADIGTDHAFLPISLIERKVTHKVYACDIAKGPLESAKKNIDSAGFANQISTILTNGLDDVPNDVEVVVIAGMGFYTARDILENAFDRLNQFREIIVEVNRNTDLLRRWISLHRFTILDEIAVYENKHDYIIVKFCANDHEPYSEDEIIGGTDLLRRHASAFETYRRHRIGAIDKIIQTSNGKAPAILELQKEKTILENAD